MGTIFDKVILGTASEEKNLHPGSRVRCVVYIQSYKHSRYYERLLRVQHSCIVLVAYMRLGGRYEGDWRRSITVTLSTIKFST
jgi:hypothetical protein